MSSVYDLKFWGEVLKVGSSNGLVINSMYSYYGFYISFQPERWLEENFLTFYRRNFDLRFSWSSFYEFYFMEHFSSIHYVIGIICAISL